MLILISVHLHTRRLDHPNIVKYHWHLKTEKNLYVVLELVKGGDLFDAIVDHGKGFNEVRAFVYVYSFL
jgi:serine/threonine protein kinase